MQSKIYIYNTWGLPYQKYLPFKNRINKNFKNIYFGTNFIEIFTKLHFFLSA